MTITVSIWAPIASVSSRMPRRKPTSTKQLKADRQIKRAVKRGDIPRRIPVQKAQTAPEGRFIGPNPECDRVFEKAAVDLHKVTSDVPRGYEVISELVGPATADPPRAALLTNNKTGGEDDVLLGQLSCPRRPKWRFDMT